MKTSFSFVPLALAAALLSACPPAAITCPTGQIMCGNGCVDPTKDRDFCGATADCAGANIGVACTAGQICSAGACAVSCPPGQVSCGGACVNPNTSREFCGATGDCAAANAGTACTAGNVCASGTCAVSCPGNQINCGGECVDPQTSRSNCGATSDCVGANDGNICGAGTVCAAGTCAVSCPAGQIECGGECVDPDTNRNYCGASLDCQGIYDGTACTAGNVCVSGGCQVSCPGNQINCGGQCIDPNTNRDYCGASLDCQGIYDGTACTAGNVCVSGGCQVSCPGNQINCGGQCVDPATNRNYCGASGDCQGANDGNVCAVGNVCVSGGCQVSCPGNQINCGGQCVDPSTNRTYCGASTNCQGPNIGSVCPNGNVCVSGGCQVSCAGNQINCGGTCIDPQTNNTYCGASGLCGSPATDGDICAPGTICSGGSCGLTCAAPQIICGGECVNPNTSRTFCGASGNCAGQNSGRDCDSGKVCNAGICGLTCPGSKVNCGGICVDPVTDDAFCGAGLDCQANPGTVCFNNEICVASQCITTYQVESCTDLKATFPTVGDGSYRMYLSDDPLLPYPAYCYDMASASPLQYLPLVRTGGPFNRSNYNPVGGSYPPPPSSNVVTSWSRVRFDPGTVTVLPDDFRYSSSVGFVNHPGEPTTQVPYGVARDCAGTGSPTGSANIDLTGTGFRVIPNWALGGSSAVGVTTLSSGGRIVDITGGGGCGWNAPGGDRLGGVPIQLKYCVPEGCDGIDNDCDGVVDNGCPISMSLDTNDNFIPPVHGNLLGGSGFTDLCAPGMVLTGLRGEAGGNIDLYIGKCREMRVVENTATAIYTYSVATGPASSELPPRGIGGQPPFDADCPANQVVVGISGEAGGSVTDLTFHCAPLVITGSAGNFTLSRGPLTPISGHGTNSDTPFFDLAPEPYVMYRTDGRSGDWIDAIGGLAGRVGIILR